MRSILRCLFAASVVLVLVAATGCTVSSSECTADDDCAAGHECLQGGGVLAQGGICVQLEVGVTPDADAADADAGPDLCEDGEQSGQQTDVDCGGPECPPCEIGESCDVDGDCKSEWCEDGTCRQAVPDPPTDVTAVRDDASARLEWTGPDYEGIADVEDYRVRAYDRDGDETSEVTGDATRRVGSDATELLFEGLVNDTKYTFAVQAENEAGLSEESALSKPVLPRPSFVSQWDTDNDGGSEDDQLELPLVPEGNYDFTVYWGDGSSERVTDVEDEGLTHTFDEPGTYIVEISGHLEGWQFQTGGDASKLELVQQWGVLQLGDGGGYFMRADNLEVAATDTLDTRSTADMSEAFRRCTDLATIPNIDEWDMSGVEDTSAMFAGTVGDPMPFNHDLSGWDTSAVTDMSDMFRHAQSFDQDLGGWDTSNVTDMSNMFYWAEDFDGDIGGWDTPNVTDMSSMFHNAGAFDQPIGDWDTSNVTDMSSMFWHADSFDRNLSDWDTSAVTDMSSMFSQAERFNGEIGDWDTSNVTDMSDMFRWADSFNQPIGDWDTSSVTDMSGMFRDATVFNQPIGDWDTSSITDMSWMFYSAWQFDQDLGDWDVTSVEAMNSMFGYIPSIIGPGDSVELSTVHYDSLLTGWSTQDVESGIIFDAGSSEYSSGTPANARQSLIDDHDWSISDGGQAGSD